MAIQLGIGGRRGAGCDRRWFVQYPDASGEEGLRQDEHPGIIFVDGAAGRRPRLAGTGLDVWEVVETFLAEDRSVDCTATYLGIPAAVVRVAIGYYADHQGEIAAWIDRNQRIADKAEAAAGNIQALTG